MEPVKQEVFGVPGAIAGFTAQGSSPPANLKGVCSQIRFYKKGERFPAEEEYYHCSGRKGAAENLKEIIRIVNQIKVEGYSETSRTIR